MAERYSLDLKHQLQSFKQSLRMFVWLFGTAIILSFALHETEFSSIVIVFLLFWLVTAVGMCLPFHLHYLTTNWNTCLIVDHNKKRIEIVQSGKSVTYQFSEIQVIQHILGHFRPDRTRSWFPIPFNYYGYLQIISKDNKKYYITSLMLNPFSPPLPIHKTKYGLPWIWNG